MNLKDLLQGTQGQLKNQKATEFLGIATDSRKNAQGKIFFALKGDAHDGHQFLQQAIDQGAAAIVSHEWKPEYAALASQVTWVQVNDTLKALQSFATYWRRQWGKKILAVTGSNGKTSVKDFTHTLLGGEFCVLKNEGSFNNHWGLPLTLLNLKSEHDLAVVEMGMNHAGEITELCRIAEPNIIAVNNVGRAHIENFGSIEGIALAKEEIYKASAKESTAIFNLADPFTKQMYERYQNHFAHILTLGTQASDIYFELLQNDAQGLKLKCRLLKQEQTLLVPLFGEQNVLNLMTACGLAIAAGAQAETLFRQLPLCRTSWGRNQWVQLASGARLLFDGYNANPDSFSALLSNLQKIGTQEKQIIGVFSEMREQGKEAPSAHFELGKLIAESLITDCYFMGESHVHFRAGFELSKKKKNLVTTEGYEQSLALKIKSMLSNKTLVVIKGSRGGALERVVQQLDPIDFTTK